MGNMQISINECQERKTKPSTDGIAFGRNFTDHMFIADYTEGIGWHDHRIVPYEPITLDPSAIIFHYGQTVFEGLKAYRAKDGAIRLFRPEENFRRMNESCDRLCMPQINEADALEALRTLIKVDREWVPEAEGTSLYIRPYMIATEPHLGVAPSLMYKFIIILSPVGMYYKEGIAPVKILVENEYVRAVAGGTGAAKTAGNYAASLKAQAVAEKMGYSQVLWLDGVEKKYVEEVGSMNVFFKVDGEVVTPALNGSILGGITRKSIIEMLKSWGVPVTERRITMEEIKTAQQEGRLDEAFGTGTAAVISPIGEFSWKGDSFTIHGGEAGELSTKLYEELTGLQTGVKEDTFGWVTEIREEAAVRN
ncbi:branched-chain amino acid aminotransferase [Bhargavaea ginsengi]|uniref:branched-chain amino acid aminotransferase n=1 Tax=Bhargavaea ginsengi TaxID=426757 RepID=UPI00203B579C|nr:branched-chain amino acid aminotransferase [Bhargavaea ginsengi]MCM3089283.1 branched-chain amino acid aminotransferase [Bhargavaea ginsengi]